MEGAEGIRTKLEEFRAAARSCGKRGGTVEARVRENEDRTKLHAKLDALRSELVHRRVDGGDGLAISNECIPGELEEVEALLATLALQPVQTMPSWFFAIVDVLFRAPTVYMYLVFLGVVVSVPLLLLTVLEQQFPLLWGQWSWVTSKEVKPPVAGQHLSTLVKRAVSSWMLLLMGVSLRVEGLEDACLSRPGLLFFSHTSTMDAMIVLAAFPRAFCAVVKEELLMVPLIGWIVASHGGVPINRRNRASAVQALAETAEQARQLGLFVAVAPEGTRSKTGQLGHFKKGGLHMQEQLQWPIIPVTIRGAFELMPPKWWGNLTGNVSIHFHRKIEGLDVSSREELSHRVRQEMLQALQIPNPEAGTSLSPTQRLKCISASLVTYWAMLHMIMTFINLSRCEGISVWGLIAGALGYSVAATLFVYFVYARRSFGGGARMVAKTK
ncbi:unnamed protein product [Choristocarpus tenellus]